MEQREMLDVLVQVKRIGSALDEVMSVSRELAEAVDRDDRVSVNMIISMRAEPIDKLKAADKALRAYLKDMKSREDADRLAGVLNGAKAENEAEEMLSKQVAANKRQFEKVAALDKILNKKIARDKSVYS